MVIIAIIVILFCIMRLRGRRFARAAAPSLVGPLQLSCPRASSPSPDILSSVENREPDENDEKEKPIHFVETPPPLVVVLLLRRLLVRVLLRPLAPKPSSP
jgi:hypothetical protein